MTSGLVVEKLVARRGQFRVGPLNLDAEPGTLIALIGPNGGGKTTLLKTLAGLLPPLTGRVVHGGGDARAAYLPPPGSLSAALPVAHVVALGRAALRGWSPVLGHADRQAALAALESLGIGALAMRSFDMLSSGQQQLVLMARLLNQPANLCLLDEPTALLDPSHAACVEQAIRRLAGEGRTVIASTHHLALAARADMVIAVGRSIDVGPPATALSATALSSLYEAPLELCPCCHQPNSCVSTVP